MAATIKLQLPYPVGTDRIMDGDDAIHALASRLDLILARGTVTLTTNASGAVTINHGMTVTPLIFLCAVRNSARLAIPDPSSYTSVSAGVYVRNISDGSIVPNNSNDFQWFGFA